jgi:hypothetical protein
VQNAALHTTCTCTLPATSPQALLLLDLPQVHAVSRNGDAPCIATFDALPSYQDIEALLKSRPGSAMNKSLFDRLKDEWKFNQDSLQNPPQ